MSEVIRKRRQEQFENRFFKINLLFSYFSKISCISREAPDQFEIYLNKIKSSKENIIGTLEVNYRHACNGSCFVNDLYRKCNLSKYKKEIDYKNELFWRSITSIRIIFKNDQICIEYRTKRDGEYHVVKEDWYEMINILVGNSNKEITFRNDKRKIDLVIGVRMRNFKKEVVIAIYDEDKYIIYDMKHIMNYDSLHKLSNMITRDMMKSMNERMKEIEKQLLKIQDDDDRITEMIENVEKKKENEIQLKPEKKQIKISFTKEYFEMSESEDNDMSSMEKEENDIKKMDMNEHNKK